MTLYRLVAGTHEEKAEPPRVTEDGTLAYRRYKAGDVFESSKPLLNLNTGGNIKFEVVMQGAAPGQLSPNMDVWDRDHETLEMFVDRMKLKGQMNPAGIAAMPNPNAAPQLPQGVPSQPTQLQGQPTQPQAQSQPIPACNMADLSEMDDRKLRAIAAEEEIDVSKCKSKGDLIKAIKAGQVKVGV